MKDSNFLKRKGYDRLLILLKIILDLCLFITLIPVYAALALYLFVVGRNSKKQKAAIFCGLEHVIQKTINRGDFFKKKGFRIFYFSFEKTYQAEINPSNKEVIKIKRFLAIDVIRFIIILIRRNPVYVELYFEGLGINQLFYVGLSRLNRSLTISILRGELYNFEKRKKTRNRIRLTIWKLSDFIFYREIYMKNYFDSLNIADKKVYFDPNRVPVKDHCDFNRGAKNVLFLNGIKTWRRIDLFVEAIPLVLEKVPGATFTIVGCRSDEELEYVNSLAQNHKVSHHLTIYPWASQPAHYYESASIFVLPADLIFCNFSLIESMERGVPAIVANVEDADKIVQHGKNGYLAEQTAKDIAKYIIHLLSDETSRKEMGKNARETIINNFNDKDRMAPILDLIINKYPYLYL